MIRLRTNLLLSASTLACVAMTACAGDFPEINLSESANLNISPSGGSDQANYVNAPMQTPNAPSNGSPQLGEADAGTQPRSTMASRLDGAVPAEPGLRPSGVRDEWTYFGACKLVITGPNGVLANDNLDPPTTAGIVQNQRGYGIEVGGQDGNRVRIQPDGSVHFDPDPMRLGEQFTATYTLISPAGRSEPILITFNPPSNHVVVSPNAPDGVFGDGLCSLREAAESPGRPIEVVDCDLPDGPINIVFDSVGTVVLDKLSQEDGTPIGDAQGGDIDIFGTVTIVGCGTNNHIIDAGRRSRLFEVRAGASLELHDLNLQKGKQYVGGAILNRGNLLLNNVGAGANVAVGPNGASSCGGAGSGGGGLGAGGVLATTNGSTTLIRGSANKCVFFANSARGGQGGTVEPVRLDGCWTGGRGGGQAGGSGGIGDEVSADNVNGNDGGFGSGGGGGGPRLLDQSGRGGHGGWGGGAGGGALGQPGGSGGRGGFGGGDGTRDERLVGGRGGGGAGLGGAITVFGGIVTIEGCKFDSNQALPGGGGLPPQELLVAPGGDGQSFGHDAFVVRGELVANNVADLRVVKCQDVSDNNTACDVPAIPE